MSQRKSVRNSSRTLALSSSPWRRRFCFVVGSIPPTNMDTPLPVSPPEGALSFHANNQPRKTP